MKRERGEERRGGEGRCRGHHERDILGLRRSTWLRALDTEGGRIKETGNGEGEREGAGRRERVGGGTRGGRREEAEREREIKAGEQGWEGGRLGGRQVSQDGEKALSNERNYGCIP